MPREAFRQYFSLLLALGKGESAFANATLIIRNKLIDLVIENRIVSAFVDICPGLEPAVLLGKIHWEASEGQTPDASPWRHVVVDAPATGHGLMLFKSTAALTEVFGAGTIFKQATAIMEFVRDPARTELNIVTTLEELPLRESLDMQSQLRVLDVAPACFVANRVKAPSPGGDLAASMTDPVWQHEMELEREIRQEEAEMLAEFRRAVAPVPIVLLPETPKLPPKPAGTRAKFRGANAMSEIRAQLLVVLGAGGVGKTTSAAALSLALADRGQKVVVITVDPAKRLAQALGLDALSDEPKVVAEFPDSGGKLSALWLDSRVALDDLVRRHGASLGNAEKILRHRLFKIIQTQLGGIEEYLGIEKILSLGQKWAVRRVRARHAAVAPRPRFFLKVPNISSASSTKAYCASFCRAKRATKAVFSAAYFRAGKIRPSKFFGTS